MPGASVVVLDGDAEGRYRGELCRILEPAFAVEVHDLPWDGALPIPLTDPGPAPIPPAALPHRGRPELLFILAPGGSVAPMLSLVERVRHAHPTLPLIGVIDTPDPFEVEGLLTAGITDFVTPPLRSVDILPRVRRLLAHTGTRDPLQQVRRAALGLRDLIGNSPEFLGQLERIPRVSRCDAGVLIVGETGTGKELFARGIHYLSPRSHAPFLPVNCGAIPVDLAESELFGHARGAYTGAVTSYPGLIREAEGGTLFLDEIDCLPAAGQVKLLRFLQDKEYRALGTTGMLKANVRVIAASNAAIEVAIREGRFRQDLLLPPQYHSLPPAPLAQTARGPPAAHAPLPPQVHR